MLWLGLYFGDLELEVFDLPANLPAGSLTNLDKPVVIIDDNQVVSTNAQAQQAGVLPGATLATAHSIAADLVHYHKDSAREQQRLTILANSLLQLSSHISLIPPHGLLLEVSRSLKLFRSSQRLQSKAVKLCQALGHQSCARLAATPAAAMALARSGMSELDSVPLHSLALPAFSKSVIERCHNMGVYELGALLALPHSELGQRFGKLLLQQLQRLTGQIPDPQTFITPTETFSQALHLLDPIHSKGGLQGPMQRLATQLQHWLVGRELAVQQVRWHFAAHDAESRVTLDVKFANPQRMSTGLLNITQLKLEQQALPADVLTLQLDSTQLLPWQEHSKDLFQLLNKSRGYATRGDLVDRLRARLGDDACQTLSLADQHHPQWSWHGQALDNLPSALTPNPTGQQTQQIPPKKSRPLWLLKQPKAMTEQELALLQGPERIRTGWWKAGIFRDYYIARLRTGAYGWVFVDRHQQWYLHGYFA